MSPISKAMAPLEGYWCPPAPKQPGHGPPAMRTSLQRKNHWNSWKNSWNTSWFMFIIVVEFFDMVDDLTDLILIDFVLYSIDLKWLMVDVKVRYGSSGMNSLPMFLGSHAEQKIGLIEDMQLSWCRVWSSMQSGLKQMYRNWIQLIQWWCMSLFTKLYLFWTLYKHINYRCSCGFSLNPMFCRHFPAWRLQ